MTSSEAGAGEAGEDAAKADAAKADAAKADIRALMAEKGHAVDIARRVAVRLEAAFASGELERTPALDAMLGDLADAVEQDDDQRLGGKSAEAARFIMRAISRELDAA